MVVWASPLVDWVGTLDSDGYLVDGVCALVNGVGTLDGKVYLVDSEGYLVYSDDIL